jgi:hypothetical protein
MLSCVAFKLPQCEEAACSCGVQLVPNGQSQAGSASACATVITALLLRHTLLLQLRFVNAAMLTLLMLPLLVLLLL